MSNEELLRNRMYAILSKDLVTNTKTHNELVTALDEIMSLITQPEQLREVYITQYKDNKYYFIDPNGDWFEEIEIGINSGHETKQEALDFCRKFNLKVVNDEGKS